MARERTDYRERRLLRERRLRERLGEETRGLADCGQSSRGRYVAGCRCAACREKNREYRRERAIRKTQVECGAPSKFVDAEPVRRKILALREQGYTVKEIERLSGVGHTELHGITVAHWRTGKPVERCLRKTKDALCSIGTRRSLSARQKVDAEWMAGWLREYRDAGLSVAAMSRAAGIDRQVLDALLHGKRERVLARTLHSFVEHKPELDRMAKEDAWER